MSYIQTRGGIFERPRNDQSKHVDSGDFPVGTAVEIVCDMQDFSFFFHETGKVIRNNHEYLGIEVEFDRPRKFKDGSIQKEFNFEPGDLEIISRPPDTGLADYIATFAGDDEALS